MCTSSMKFWIIYQALFGTEPSTRIECAFTLQNNQNEWKIRCFLEWQTATIYRTCPDYGCFHFSFLSIYAYLIHDGLHDAIADTHTNTHVHCMACVKANEHSFRLHYGKLVNGDIESLWTDAVCVREFDHNIQYVSPEMYDMRPKEWHTYINKR